MRFPYQSPLRLQPGRQRRRASLLTRRFGKMPAAFNVRVQLLLMAPVIAQSGMNLAQRQVGMLKNKSSGLQP